MPLARTFISRRTMLSGLMAGLAAGLGVSIGAQAIAQPFPTRSLPPVPPLPGLDTEGYTETSGAKIWYGRIGAGPPVILLHGGMASSRSWALQVPALIAAGHEVILVDSRGHGQSTLGASPLRYELLADDIAAVIAELDLDAPSLIGWSDGGIVALMLAGRANHGLSGVFAFGANMNAQGVRADADRAPILELVGPRLRQDYIELSPAPSDFATLSSAVRKMQQGLDGCGTSRLTAIEGLSVTIAAGSDDEFITPEHPEYLAKHISGARLRIIRDAGHFAPWQQPTAFNRLLLEFLGADRRLATISGNGPDKASAI